MKSLVVVYSGTGSTLSVAQRIATELGADLETIEDKVDRKGILGFLRSGYEALREKTPPIAEPKHNPRKYDLVVVGTPIWAGRMSSPVRTYLSRTSGLFKQVAFFCTSRGGGNQRVFFEMARIAAAEPIATLELTSAQVKAGEGSTSIQNFVSKVREVLGILGLVKPPETESSGS